MDLKFIVQDKFRTICILDNSDATYLFTHNEDKTLFSFCCHCNRTKFQVFDKSLADMDDIMSTYLVALQRGIKIRGEKESLKLSKIMDIIDPNGDYDE